MDSNLKSETIILSVRGISHHFRKNQVLTNVSFDAEQGTCVGVVGLNGSGKSTLLSVLAGIRKPSGGEFTCCGHAMLRERRWFPRLISYVPQENPLIEELTVRDNLRLWTGGEENTGDILERMQITDLMEEKAGNLSGGTKRRLVIACAMAGSNPVLIMDEPTSSLDLHQKDIIYRCMDEYLKEKGTILLATHDEREIRTCDVLYYIENGEAERKPADEVIRLLRKGS